MQEKDLFLTSHLQPEITSMLLVHGVLRLTRQKIEEGATLFGLAQEALEMLQREDVSSKRLVWPVWIVSLDLVQCSATPPNDASQL